MFKVTKLFDDFGCVISPENDNHNLLSFDTTEIFKKIHTFGAVIFRGFETNSDKFKLITERFSGSFISHIAPQLRPTVGDDPTITEVLSGNGLIYLHGEMYYLPNRPDFLWLYCIQPAAIDGETTVCNSTSFLEALSAKTRKLLEENKVHYHFFMTKNQVEIGLGKTREQVVQSLESRGVTEFKFDKEDGLNFTTTSLAIKTLPNGKKGFINSIANISQYSNSTSSKIKMELENGIPLVGDLLSEIAEAGESVAEKIKWQAGDVLVVDNKWVLHGRRPFTGQRKILTRFGMAA